MIEIVFGIVTETGRSETVLDHVTDHVNGPAADEGMIAEEKSAIVTGIAEIAATIVAIVTVTTKVEAIADEGTTDEDSETTSSNCLTTKTLKL